MYGMPLDPGTFPCLLATLPFAVALTPPLIRLYTIFVPACLLVRATNGDYGSGLLAYKAYQPGRRNSVTPRAHC